MRVTSPPSWSAEDTQRAKEAWQRYQARHDVRGEVGRMAGIDPKTGDVWVGEDIIAVVDAARAAGSDRPLLFLRVGFDYTFRKGGSARGSGRSHA